MVLNLTLSDLTFTKNRKYFGFRQKDAWKRFGNEPFECMKNMKVQQYLFAQRYAAKCLQHIKKYFTLISNLDGYGKEARK